MLGLGSIRNRFVTEMFRSFKRSKFRRCRLTGIDDELEDV